jgi:hypothetical protein
VGCSSGASTSQSAAPSATATLSTVAAEDEKFITVLGVAGASITKEQALSSGRRACGALGEGQSPADIRSLLVQKGLSDAQASRLMLAAAKVYCPEFEKVVNP